MWSSVKGILFSSFLGVGIVAVVLALLFLGRQTGRAADGVFCVAPAGSGMGPFAACDQVFDSIQAAVDTAVGGEEIWVAAGVYTDVQLRGSVRQIVYLNKDVTIRGGYAIPFAVAPDAAVNPTTLDAQQQGRGIYVVSGTTATIIGFRITGGDASGLGGAQNSPLGWGGGVFGSNVTVTISDTVIYSNTAEGGDWPHPAGFGGGLAFRNSRVVLQNNVIQNNLASVYGQGVGGGVAMENSEFYIADNSVLSNTAVISPSSTGNFVLGAGGGLALDSSTGTLFRNTIQFNRASSVADGFFADGNGQGGGYYIYASKVTAIDDIIQGNKAELGGGGGAVIEFSAAIMTNVVVIDNAAARGAGLSVLGSQVALLHPTVARNEGNEAVFVSDDVPEQVSVSSFVTMTNGIMADHATGIFVADGNQMAVNGVLWFQTPVAISSEPLAVVSVSHQLVGDPLFAADGYHITAGSAARFQGVASGTLLDVDGEGRPSANPSLGADEYWPFKLFFPVVSR